MPSPTFEEQLVLINEKMLAAILASNREINAKLDLLLAKAPAFTIKPEGM